ncbi:DUF3570 domain-containing protein [Paraglaciecola sp. 25GB23A]|uniref:DUF3570 domain-containing protein n=1 Tax=Paraglaciecola sp. 25GB23A TaxID=3156068 RepID=UPI0032AE9148
MKKTINITAALASATCALLHPYASANDMLEGWKVDTSLMYYGETDRVTAVETVIAGQKDFGDERLFTGKIVIDTLTGASATGAVAQLTAQTVSRPSGQGSYTVNAGETPLDNTFKDTRVQVDGQWTQPWSDVSRITTGLHLSTEHDYYSLGFNGSYAHDFYNKNTTLSGGLAYSYDVIKPEGGLPVPFSTKTASTGYSEDYDDDGYIEEDGDDNYANDERSGSSDNKSTIDVLFGLTQVINRRMLMQFNLGVSQINGYSTDPYKVLSIVNDQGLTQSLVYENRPDSRIKTFAFWQTKYALDFGVADFSYRFATDDWKVDSHTFDSRLRINLSDSSYLQPHFRYYNQSAAEFFQPFLMEGQALPEFATADYRLGEMTAYTLGLKYGMELDNGDELSFRLEYYQQSPKNAGFTEPGTLKDVDLYPSVKAVIAQVNYRF